jgi:hypothetical protein
MFTFGEGLRADGARPITALKIFMFFFVGGLVGLGHLFLGGSPSLVPLVIGLAGLGAVACVRLFVRSSQHVVTSTNPAPLPSKRLERAPAEYPQNGYEVHIREGQGQQ